MDAGLDHRVVINVNEQEQLAAALEIAPDAPAAAVATALERLIPATDPCLQQYPFKVVLGSELPPDFQSELCLGFYCPDNYHTFRQYLRRDDGAGIVLVVNDLLSRAEQNAAERWIRELLFHMEEHQLRSLIAGVQPSIERLVAVAAHETAHAVASLLNGSFDFIMATTTERHTSTSYIATRRAALLATTRTEETTAVTEPDQSAHNLHFTRTLLHLTTRLAAAGAPCRTLAGGAEYGQRPIEECRAALQSELNETWRRPLREILASPMPREFEQCDLRHPLADQLAKTAQGNL